MENSALDKSHAPIKHHRQRGQGGSPPSQRAWKLALQMQNVHIKTQAYDLCYQKRKVFA